MVPISIQVGGILCICDICLFMFTFRMCQLFVSEFTSFVAALLFAVHPVHTEAVGGIP